MYDNILIPTDGSNGVRDAVIHGLEIASDNNATVHALYVIDRRLAYAASDTTTEDVTASLKTEGETAVDDIKQQASDRGLGTVTSVVEGIPATSILDYVDDEDIDLVVMGTHGRTGRDRLAHLGSVTDRVVRGATIPVLVVDISNT